MNDRISNIRNRLFAIEKWEDEIKRINFTPLEDAGSLECSYGSISRNHCYYEKGDWHLERHCFYIDIDFDDDDKVASVAVTMCDINGDCEEIACWSPNSKESWDDFYMREIADLNSPWMEILDNCKCKFAIAQIPETEECFRKFASEFAAVRETKMEGYEASGWAIYSNKKGFQLTWKSENEVPDAKTTLKVMQYLDIPNAIELLNSGISYDCQYIDSDRTISVEILGVYSKDGSIDVDLRVTWRPIRDRTYREVQWDLCSSMEADLEEVERIRS